MTRLSDRRGGREVEGSGLLNRQVRKGFLGSNPSLSALIVIACTIISLSSILWAAWHGVNPAPAESEFFAYSWVYGVRWGAGEAIFQPHSQLIYPIFAAINAIAPGSILEKWKAVSQYWPAFLIVLSLGMIYATADRKALLYDVAISSALYLIAIPLFVDRLDLFSVSYHSLAVPLALGGLWFWKDYDRGRDPSWIGLGIYTAACVLGKPTFVAFAVPFFAMEFYKGNCARAFNAGVVAITIYLNYLWIFYGSTAGMLQHFEFSRLFMTSQYDWYDTAKGATPFHWYFGYAIGVMGWVPTFLLAATLAYCGSPSLVRYCYNRKIILVGIVSAFAAAMFVLYHRSQVHGQPEYMALALVTTIGVFRCSARSRLVSLIAVTSGAVLLMIFPTAESHRQYIEDRAKFDDFTIPAIFHPGVKTLVVQKYPDVIPGTIDVWCRGGDNLFDRKRSPAADHFFPDAVCSTYGQPIDIKPFSRLIFIEKPTTTIESIARDFPAIAGHFHDCGAATPPLPDNSVLVECKLAPSIDN